MYKAKLIILFLLAGSQIYQGPQEATPHGYFVHVCTILGILYVALSVFAIHEEEKY